MKKQSPLISIIVLVVAGMIAMSTSITAQNPSLQVFEDFRTDGGIQNQVFRKSVTRTDASGFIYIAGSTINASGNYDMLVVKYKQEGIPLWTRTFDGPGSGDDVATDVQIDASGNVYVCGSYFENATDSNNAILQKFDPNGNILWYRYFNGTSSGNDGLARIEFSGNSVYTVGSTWGGLSNLYDFLCLKYDVSGNLQWTGTWNNANLMDAAIRVKVKNNKVSVTGGSQVNSFNYKYAVANFDVATGTFINAHTSGGNQAIAFDQVTDMQMDANGNIFITGGVMNNGQGYDFRTEMLDATLTSQWAMEFNGTAGLDDMASSLALDGQGNVIVTGYSTTLTQGKNYVTIKYDPNGNLQWQKTFNGTDNKNDSAAAVVVNAANEIYVTGTSAHDSTYNYYTLKYDASGNLIWEIGFNGFADGTDVAFDLALAGYGSIVVIGQSEFVPGKFKYTTVKYIEKSITYPDDTITSTSTVVFTRNNGQVVDTGGNQRSEIKYYTLCTSPRVYFMDTTVSYLYARIDTSTSNNDSIVRVDQKFIGANQNLKVYSTDERPEYYNFYLGHIPEGRTHVSNYSTLVTFNVWNNVDVLYGGNARGLKTYYVCKPGAGGGSATQIDLKFFGADSVRIGTSGELLIYTQLGVLVQPKASAWQLDASGNYQSLGWQPSYNLVATNEIKFTNFGSYNPALPLVIAVDWGDNFYPTIVTDNLLWSTFMGGSDDDVLYSVSVNASNWAFDGGETMSINFINAAGGYQGQNGGSKDGIIGMYNTGMWLWRTYYGGVAGDGIASVSANGGTNSVYFTGYTLSADFPVGGPSGTFSAYSTTTNGPGDAIIGKLTGAGVMAWATCYGSTTGGEAGSIVKADYQFNSFYVAGHGADASTPLTTETGASNLTVGDAFILKFNPNTFVREWATLYGGTPTATDKTFITDMELGANSTNHIVITGYTGTTNLPSPTNSDPGGHNDAYIASFNSNDVLNWSTYYGGAESGKYDISSGVVVNSMGEIFIAGTTTSSDLPVPNPNGGWSDNSYAGGVLVGDAFVAQFNSSGNLIWGTYLGGSGDEEAFDLATDYMDNIYVIGYSRSSTFPGWPFATNPSGVWAHPLHGTSNAFIVQFDRWQGLGWGTYFGGEFADEANSIHIYKSQSSSTSYLYIAGETCSSANTGYTYPFPVVHTGAFSSASLQGSGLNFNNYATWTYRDGFIAAFELAPAIVGIENPQDSSAEFSIFPSPNSGCFSIETTTQPNEEFTIVIYDVLGQIVYSERVMATSLTFRKQIHLEQQPSGLYMVQLQFVDHTSTQQTIIQH